MGSCRFKEHSTGIRTQFSDFIFRNANFFTFGTFSLSLSLSLYIYIYIYIKLQSAQYRHRKQRADNGKSTKKVIYESCKAFVTRRIEHWRLKQILRKQDSISDSYTLLPEHIGNICSMVCLSKAGLTCRMRTHDSKLSKTVYTKVSQQQPTGNSCQFCEKVWGSPADLRSHIGVYRINVNGKNSQLIWHKCNDILDLRSHMFSHRYS